MNAPDDCISTYTQLCREVDELHRLLYHFGVNVPFNIVQWQALTSVEKLAALRQEPIETWQELLQARWTNLD